MFKAIIAIGAVGLMAGAGMLLIQIIEDRGALKSQRTHLMGALAEETNGRDRDRAELQALVVDLRESNNGLAERTATRDGRIAALNRDLADARAAAAEAALVAGEEVPIEAIPARCDAQCNVLEWGDAQ